MRLPHKRLYFVVAFFTVVLLVGCGMEEIRSTWCDRQTTINEGGFVKWENAGRPVAIGDITVNVLNDDQTVYMRLASTNPAYLSRFIQAGFTVWFDEKGGDRKTYGIKFPLPVPSTNNMAPRASSAQKSDVKKDPKRDAVAERLREIAQGDIEIFRPGENEFSTLSADYSAPYGIRCRLDYTKGLFAYELYMPLVKDKSHPYAIADSRPKILGIGLETGKVEQQRFQENPTGRRANNPMTRIGGDSGPELVGSQAAGKSISQWLKVQLVER